MEVREATGAEHPEVAAVTVAAYEAVFGAERLGGYRHELEDVALRAREGTVLVAATPEVGVVGAVTYVPGPHTQVSEFDDEDGCGIRMLAVDPREQGHGAGRALVAACIELGRREGRARVVLHSTPEMTTARRLYATLGFARTPSRDVVVAAEAMGDGVALHLMAYVLVLSTP